MNYSQILIALSFFIIFSCQEKKAEDSGAADLNKQKEELLRQKEELLEEKAKMLEEAEKSSEQPKKEEKIAKPKFTDMRGNACLIGEWYFAQINDGEEFQVLITNENWLRAVAPDGTEGYISANRVNPMYIGQ